VVRCPLRSEAVRERREAGRAARWLTGRGDGKAPVRRVARSSRGCNAVAGRADRDVAQAHRRPALEYAGDGVPAARRGSRGARGAGRSPHGGLSAPRGQGPGRGADSLPARAMRSIASIILCAGCAQALHNPGPIEAIGAAPRASAAQLLADADAAWARRGEPEQAAAAEDLYLQAARADPRNPGSFAGAIRAKAFRIGREKDGAERTRLAESAVITGQLCQENAPKAPACDYWLAAALGLQARERSATGHDALPRMVDLLRRAIRTDPAIDQAGPHRLLAIVLLRAPGWPMGPGDAEAALPEAQAAARTAPGHIKRKKPIAGARAQRSSAVRNAAHTTSRG